MYYFTYKIQNAANFIFYPRIHHSEMHDHVSVLGEQHVSICCAYKLQLHWLRWAKYICKLGLLLAESSTYPHKTTLIWNTDFLVQVCSLAFIQQTSSSRDRANDTVEEMSEKKTDQKKKKLSQKWWSSYSSISLHGKASLQQTTRCTPHLWYWSNAET